MDGKSENFSKKTLKWYELYDSRVFVFAACGFVSVFALVIEGVDKRDRQIVSHRGRRGEGVKKPLHMNKQWVGVISKRSDNDRKKGRREKGPWFSPTKWHWNYKVPSLTLSLSWGGGSQTINSSALKSVSPVIILITILILVMDKTLEIKNEMLPKTCEVVLDHS